MEIYTVPSQELKCLMLTLPKLKGDPREEKGSSTMLGSRDEKAVDLCLKYSGEESSNNDVFIESVPIGGIKYEMDELDQKESNLCLEKSSHIKWETKTFEKVPVESKDRNIDNTFDNNVIEHYAIKKEINDLDEVAAEELNDSHENPIKSEIIKQEEIHIKHEEDKEDSPNEIISEFRKKAVLHQCSECPYSTNRKSQLKAHSIRHKKGDEIDWYSCQECPYKTSRKFNLKCHAETHNKLILKCSECSYVTLKSSRLKRHAIEHKPNIQWLNCPDCSYKSHVRSLFRRHILVHKKSYVFECSKCSYQSKTKHQLIAHQVKHESMDKLHSCPVCRFKSRDKNTLEAHCRVRHSMNPNTKQFVILKCTECCYENWCKHTLKKHQVIHDQSRWLQCPDCVYKTPYKNDLKKHQVRHQGENGEGWYRCLECPYKATRDADLRRHVMTHKSADEIRWFECLQCSFKTAYKKSLRRHELKHKEAHEVEWFCCYECSFKTAYKRCLVNHISKHKK